MIKEIIRRIPVVGDVIAQLYWKMRSRPNTLRPFAGSKAYWEHRYQGGGDSGVGSYGKFADFKAEVLNAFVAEKEIDSVIEFGCGDGNQLTLAKYPRYLGFDVSEHALASCRERFSTDGTKSFRLMTDYAGERADLALSLDVIYHLVEDEIFDAYMRTLFDAADRFVIIYASNTDDNREYEGTHVKHRKFTPWIARYAPNWTMVRRLPNRFPYRGDYREGSFADFSIFGRDPR